MSRIGRDDLRPAVVRDLGVKRMLVPDEEGNLEEKEVRMVSFGLAERYTTKASFDRDWIALPCPTKPRTECTATIEFDALELERLFKEVANAFQLSCPGCRRPLGLIELPGRAFLFGALP